MCRLRDDLLARRPIPLELRQTPTKEDDYSLLSRSYPATAIDIFLSPDHHGCGVVAILADVFRELFVRAPSKKETRCPGTRVRTGIINGDFNLHIVRVRACKAFGEVKLVRMRCALALHPESFIETDRVHDEAVTFPVPNRVAVETGNDILGMRPAVHVNDSERLGTVFIQNVDRLRFRYVHKL